MATVWLNLSNCTPSSSTDPPILGGQWQLSIQPIFISWLMIYQTLIQHLMNTILTPCVLLIKVKLFWTQLTWSCHYWTPSDHNVESRRYWTQHKTNTHLCITTSNKVSKVYDYLLLKRQWTEGYHLPFEVARAMYSNLFVKQLCLSNHATGTIITITIIATFH